MESLDSGSNLWSLASSVLESLLLMVESMEVAESNPLISCDSTGDAVEITNGDTTYLISWHAPTSQIWVASPRSGSVRFVYDAGRELWWDTRGEQELLAFVKAEVCEIFGR